MKYVEYMRELLRTKLIMMKTEHRVNPCYKMTDNDVFSHVDVTKFRVKSRVNQLVGFFCFCYTLASSTGCHI